MQHFFLQNHTGIPVFLCINKYIHIQAICAAVRSPCCLYTESGALRLLDTIKICIYIYMYIYICMCVWKHKYIYIHIFVVQVAPMPLATNQNRFSMWSQLKPWCASHNCHKQFVLWFFQHANDIIVQNFWAAWACPGLIDILLIYKYIMPLFTSSFQHIIIPHVFKPPPTRGGRETTGQLSRLVAHSGNLRCLGGLFPDARNITCCCWTKSAEPVHMKEETKQQNTMQYKLCW